jgi:putative FmdB family regulatory protein
VKQVTVNKNVKYRNKFSFMAIIRENSRGQRILGNRLCRLKSFIIQGFDDFCGVKMPIYAYRCDECGFAKDVLQKISDPQLTVCPTCGKSAFKKQVTAAGFQLKGTGWYATDFRGGTAPSTATAPSTPAAKDTAAPAAAPAGPATTTSPT